MILLYPHRPRISKICCDEILYFILLLNQKLYIFDFWISSFILRRFHLIQYCVLGTNGKTIFTRTDNNTVNVTFRICFHHPLPCIAVLFWEHEMNLCRSSPSDPPRHSFHRHRMSVYYKNMFSLHGPNVDGVIIAACQFPFAAWTKLWHRSPQCYKL